MKGRYYVAAVFALIFASLLGFSAAGNVGITASSPFAYISYPVDWTNYSISVDHFNWEFNPVTATVYNCTYTFDGGTTLDLVNCSAGTYNFGALADGGYHLELMCDYSLGANLSHASLTSVDFLVDTTAPIFADETHRANPITYVNGAVYGFYVNVTDAGSGIDSVWLEFAGQNRSVTKNGNTYGFVISDLGVGTYSFKWFANDSLGNFGYIGPYYYIVMKANPVPGMSISGTTPIDYGTVSDFAGAETNEGDGNCSYTLSPANGVIRGGATTFTYSTAGCENYSAGSVTKVLNVNRVPSATTLSASAVSPIVYGNLVSFSCSNDAGLENELYIDGVDRTSDMGSAILLDAKDAYNVTCFGVENENYTGSSDGIEFVVDKASQTAVLNLNPASSVTYGTSVNAACNGELFRDDANVTDEIGQNVILGVGSYNYSCKLYETANYLFAEANETLVVDKADPTLVGTPVMSIIMSPSSSVDVGTETNVTGVGCPAELVCGFYLDGAEVNNSDVKTFGAGMHLYVYNTTGNENYSAAEVSAYLTVVGPLYISSGGGGGGGTCYSNWTCTSWSACDLGVQTRKCSLVYDACYASQDKPAERQSCSYSGGFNNSESAPTKLMDEGVPDNAGITGAAIGGLSGGSWLIIGIFAVAIAGAYGFTAWRKQRFRTALEKTLWQAAHSNIKK